MPYSHKRLLLHNKKDNFLEMAIEFFYLSNLNIEVSKYMQFWPKKKKKLEKSCRCNFLFLLQLEETRLERVTWSSPLVLVRSLKSSVNGIIDEY